MITKTVRSRFDHQIGESVEGGLILEKRTVIPPDPAEKRRGVYEYVVEVPPAAAAPKPKSSPKTSAAPERDSFTRASPDEMGSVIRRLPSR